MRGVGPHAHLPTFLPSHLPAYLVAAFAKRLSRLALTAPPEALLMVLPFICNLLRRHPSCRVLVHRPRGPGEWAVTVTPARGQRADGWHTTPLVPRAGL